MWLAQYMPSRSSNSIRPTAERHNKTMPTTKAANGMTTTQKAILRCRARASSPARDAAGSDLPVALHTCSMQLFFTTSDFLQNALKLPVDVALTAPPLQLFNILAVLSRDFILQSVIIIHNHSIVAESLLFDFVIPL